MGIPEEKLVLLPSGVDIKTFNGQAKNSNAQKMDVLDRWKYWMDGTGKYSKNRKPFIINKAFLGDSMQNKRLFYFL